MLRDLTQRARGLRPHQTSAEWRLWYELLSRRQLLGLRFLRQRPLLGIIVDFYCPSLKLAIELDGQVHDERLAHDAWRSRELAAKGIAVIRYTNEEVLGNLAGVREDLLRRIAIIEGRTWPDQTP